MFSLKEKISIVTGGGSGIGKAITEVFARQGCTVHIVDLDENAQIIADTINAAGGHAFFHRCNVSVQSEVKEIIDSISASGKSIHILVNNAGVAHVGTAETTAESDIDRLYNVNIKGVYNCLHEVIPVMKRTGGVILNMASIASTVGITDRFAYSMTKGAVVGMTLATARDYIKYNIRCNCISPARVHTPFVDGFLAKNYPGKEKEMFDKLSQGQPIGRMAQPEEVANLALYLCSDEASFITGCDYPIDGGFIKLNN
ncbi:MAG: SDR family oxidoreductase [Chitinophagaceae bacterium]|nr:SDR family oxidoreductase [Chitinophagaceae bacterium]